jgi:hypothetical protein
LYFLLLLLLRNNHSSFFFYAQKKIAVQPALNTQPQPSALSHSKCRQREVGSSESSGYNEYKAEEVVIRSGIKGHKLHGFFHPGNEDSD